ncbi:MAG TPA: TRAP transporter small permease [Desulfobacterales bacterium]|nr:TRAP transporter small permease [Desulfobacterales bacterium]
MSTWERLDRLLAKAEQTLLVCCLALMMVTAFTQIAVRNLFGIGLTWSEPLVRYLVLWVGFLGAALAVREGKHITIEVASLWTSARESRALRAVSHTASAAVCALLAYAAARFVGDEAQLGSRTFLSLPDWVPALVVPVTFAVMALRFLLRAVWPTRPGPAPSPAAASDPA